MCESNVYLIRDGKEELVFKEVMKIVPENDEFVLYGLMGESYRIRGKIREMNLLSHKIVFEEIK